MENNDLIDMVLIVAAALTVLIPMVPTYTKSKSVKAPEPKDAYPKEMVFSNEPSPETIKDFEGDEINSYDTTPLIMIGGTPDERKALIDPIVEKLSTIFIEDLGAYSINVKNDGQYGWMSEPINEASMFAMMGETDAVAQCLRNGCRGATLAELKEIADLTVDVDGDVRTLTIADTVIVVQYH